MKLRTVGKLGVILSVILFCIGVGLYSFARLSLAESGKDADLLAVVPSDCIGLLETDNIEFMVNEFPQAAYAGQLDTLQSSGLFSVVGEDMIPYIVENAHDLHNQMNYMMVSFMLRFLLVIWLCISVQMNLEGTSFANDNQKGTFFFS